MDHAEDIGKIIRDNIVSNDSFSRETIKTIISIGMAKQKLADLLDDAEDKFEDTSKHNPYWDSEHEVESDKLYDIRCKLGWYKDKLWDIYAILNGDE